MRLLPVTLAAVLLSGPTLAQTAPSPPAAAARDSPKPDMDKPITITLAKLQRIAAAIQAQAQAQCVAQGTQADWADLVKQATPEPEKKP